MRWEYKIITLDADGMRGDAPGLELLEAELNALGGSEWELVAVLPTDRSRSIGAILKRPRESSMW